MMKIILSVEDRRGRNSYFVGDDGKTYSIVEAIALARSGQIADVRVATRGGTPYLRSSRKRNTQFTLQEITVAEAPLLRATTNTSKLISQQAYRPYWAWYQKYLESQAKNGVVRIAVDGHYFSTDAHVREKLTPLKEHIVDAAKKSNVDSYLLGGILIDEIVRLAPFEDITDTLLLNVPGWDVSVGTGQVSLRTAKDLIKSGYFNPNPEDQLLSAPDISGVPPSVLFAYILEPKNNTFFAAARIRELIDSWKSEAGIDLTPEIIATLYSLKYKKPHSSPVANTRGLQIVNEFVPFAIEILSGI